MKNSKIIFLVCVLFLLTTPGCKKKECGCNNESYRNISTTEVALRYDFGYPIIVSKGFIFYEICNKDIVTEDLLDSIKKKPYTGVKVIIDADSFPECVQGRLVVGPYLKIKSIKRANQ